MKTYQAETTRNALLLVGLYSRKWLALRLEINYRTLIRRLDNEKWTLREHTIIEKLINSQK